MENGLQMVQVLLTSNVPSAQSFFKKRHSYYNEAVKQVFF